MYSQKVLKPSKIKYCVLLLCFMARPYSVGFWLTDVTVRKNNPGALLTEGSFPPFLKV